MVGFSNNAAMTNSALINSALINSTVTFVPFFASDSKATPVGANPSVDEPPGTTRLAFEFDRPETDRAIALKVAHALAALQVPILRTLEVSVHEGHVTLRGRVRTYYERQLANAHAKRTPGVRSVRGDISVAG